MKNLARILTIIFILCFLSGCAYQDVQPQVAATTLPVYEFTSFLCQGTDVTVGRLVTENVSCLHDYTLQVRQMRMIENAQVIVLSGLGLEDFLSNALVGKELVIDASLGIEPICPEEDHHHHDEQGHHHDEDPHIWLSPLNAKVMARNICTQLCVIYPQHKEMFEQNLLDLHSRLDALYQYGMDNLRSANNRKLVTFHDGFAYFAQCFDLEILRAIEEESGREASAAELKELIGLVETHRPGVFTEKSGADTAAQVIARETGCTLYQLDMAMSGDSYFDSMYHNIDAVKEALE